MRRMFALLSILSALLVAHGTAWAEDTLGVDDAVQLALDNNAGLRQSEIAVRAAQRAMDLSWGGLIPGLSLGAGASRPNVPGTGSTTSTITINGSVSTALTLTTAVIGTMQVDKVLYDQAQLSYQTSRRTVELSVRKAYYSLLIARENIGVLQKSVDTAQKNYDQTEARRKAGLAPELDSLTALVALEKLKPTLDSAQVTYENQLADFRQLLGMDQARVPALTGTLDSATPLAAENASTPALADLTALLGSSPTITALQMSLNLARAREAAAQRSMYSPAISLALSYRPTSSDNAATWKDAGSLSATATFPLDKMLPWSQEHQSAAAAADSVATLEISLAEARTSADLQVRSLVRRIDQARSSLKALRLNATLAERTYALTEEAYRFGTRDVLSLQNAQDNLQSARMQVLSQLNTLISAALDLEYALGVPFGTLGR
ncbi:MAG TPA: TolC family protein [bacterium]|nr:TolC family protein [bacterium]